VVLLAFYHHGGVTKQDELRCSVLGAASQVTNRYSFKDLGHLSLAAPLGNHPSRVISFDPSIHPVGTCSPQFLHQSSAPRISSYSMNNSIFG
jgi:hypothetical protein